MMRFDREVTNLARMVEDNNLIQNPVLPSDASKTQYLFATLALLETASPDLPN